MEHLNLIILLVLAISPFIYVPYIVPKNKRRARLVLEADKFLATSQGYSVQNLSKIDSGTTVANYIRDKGKAIGSDATGGGALQPVSPEIQKQFEFDLTNKILKSLPS